MGIRKYTLPSEFVRRIQQQLGPEADALLQALEGAPEVSVRLHPQKGRPDDLPSHAEPVPWAAGEGFYLPERPAFVFDPLWHAGAYYVQEPSSMFIPYLLATEEGPLRILDLSAAPGGKSTHLLSYVQGRGGFVVANEPDAKRFTALAENIGRWGIGQVVVTRGWPEAWAEAGIQFDVVVVDAPCSGEGMFRKSPAVRSEWSPRRVIACSRTQRHILRAALRLVRPHGLLIYSTCTFAPDENAEQVRWLYAESGIRLRPHYRPVPPEWGIAVESVNTPGGEHPLYLFYPHRARGEGFAVTAFRVEGPRAGRPARRTPFRRVACPEEWPVPAGWSCYADGTDIRAVPDALVPWLEQMPRLRRFTAGVGVARRKGRTLLPHPEWALSIHAYRQNLHPVVPVDRPQALRYLKGHPLPLPSGFAPRQSRWVLIAYRDRLLGWGKALPSGRINNAYPTGWRIRKEAALLDRTD